MNLNKKSLLAFAERERGAFENTLKEFVEIPTVSSEPQRKGDIRRCADRAASVIREFGGQAEVLETAGNPLVHGTFSGDAGAPPTYGGGNVGDVHAIMIDADGTRLGASDPRRGGVAVGW